MFEFFKKRIKGAFSKFSKEVDEEAEEIQEEVQEKAEDKPEKEKVKEESSTQKDKEKKTDAQDTTTEKPEKKEEEKPEDKEKTTDKANVLKKTEESPEKEKETKQPEKETDKSQKEEKEEKPKADENLVKKSFFKKLNPFKKKGEEDTDFTKDSEDKSKAAEKKEIKDEYIEEEKRSFIDKISDSLTKKSLSEKKFNELFWDLEIALLENNVAVEVVDLLKKELSDKIVNKPMPRAKISETIEDTLKETIEKIFELEPVDLVRQAKNKDPFKILIVGINGSGKTTTIAKLCKLFQDNDLSPVVAASDTFRAAAIDQLKEHTDKLNVKLIRHDYGADPAAVAFDAIKYAESKKNQVVIVDTAGRLHSNSNLMDELKKVHRVTNPDFTIFIGESITGNDCVEQAKEFNKAVPIDGIILSKADIDEKGGAAISISYVIGKPVLYLGVGQNYEDLEKFDKYRLMYRMFGTEIGEE